MKVSQWQRKNCSYQLWFISVTRLNTALWKSVSLPAGDFRRISSLDGALVTYDLHTPSNIFRSTSVLWWLIPSFCLHLPEFFLHMQQTEVYTGKHSTTYQSENVNKLNLLNIKTYNATCVWSFLASWCCSNHCMSNKKDQIWHSEIFLTHIHDV